MRVLLITNDYPPRAGGIQQYLHNLVRYSSLDMRVLAPTDSNISEEAEVERSDRRFMWPSPRTRRWIGGRIEAHRPQLLVFGAPHPLAQLGPSLGRMFRIPYVVIAHGAEVRLPASIPVARGLLSRTLRRAGLVLTVSRYTARQVSRLGVTRVRVLGAGVDLDAFHPATESRSGDLPVVGCISRLVPRKGHLRVLAAAEMLHASGTPVSVLLAGGGRLEARIRHRSAAASVPVQLAFDPAWVELPDLYRACDIFAMPARSRRAGLEIEGLGIVYLEAAASGLPVIAGPSGGAPETVVPGVTGYIASTPGEIAEAVQLVLARRSEMGAAARSHAEARFSWTSVAERFDSALRDVVNAR